MCPHRSLVRFFWLFCCNKPDLEALFLLVVGAAVLVAGAPVAGACGLAGSEVVCPVPMLQVRPHFPLCFGGHQGDGEEVERRCCAAVGRLKSSLFLSMLDDGRWCLLQFSFSGRDGGGRWPNFLSPSVTFLVEGRPSLSSRLACHMGGSCCLCSKAVVCWLKPWRSRRPKWPVPGDGEVHLERKCIWTRSRFSHPED